MKNKLKRRDAKFKFTNIFLKILHVTNKLHEILEQFIAHSVMQTLRCVLSRI